MEFPFPLWIVLGSRGLPRLGGLLAGWNQNVDRSASNLNLLRDSTCALWAIDHGACLFLERISAGKHTTLFELPQNHFLAGPSASADPIDLPLERMEERVNDVLKTAPEEWFAVFSFSAEELARRLILYMRDFSSRFNPDQSDGS